MKKWYLLIALIVVGGLLWKLSPGDNDDAATGNEPARPSPIDEQLMRPAPRIQSGESVRTRVAEVAGKPDPQKPDPQKPTVALGGSDWAVVAAIYREYDAAERRAAGVQKGSSFSATVFPAKGQGSKYMVVLGSGLTQPKALQLRDEAVSAGLPSDTYVTRLTAAPAQP